MFLFLDYVTNGYLTDIIHSLNIIAILCAIFVIISKNPIISVLYLIALFLVISIYLMSIGLTFLGLSYLLVYIGAVSILFLFILMLINIRISELSSDSSNSLALSIIVFILFYILISAVIPTNLHDIYITSNFFDYFKLLNDNNSLIHPISNTWDGNLVENSHINTLGNIIYTNYFIWLIISSIILLLAMIGSIIITIKQPK